MCEHKNRKWLTGSGYKTTWRCIDCSRELTGCWNDEKEQFIHFKTTTWP